MVEIDAFSLHGNVEGALTPVSIPHLPPNKASAIRLCEPRNKCAGVAWAALVLTATCNLYALSSPWRLRVPGPLRYATEPGLPKPTADKDKIEALLQVLRNQTMPPLTRAGVAWSLAGLESPQVVQALCTVLTEIGQGKQVIRIACAEALTWPAANGVKLAVRRLYGALRAPGTGADARNAVAKALLDARGAEEVIRAIGNRLRGQRSPIAARVNNYTPTLESIWIWVIQEVGACHFRPGQSLFDLLRVETRRCALVLPGLSDILLVEAIHDAGDLISEWVVYGRPSGLALTRKLFGRFSHRDAEVQQELLKLFDHSFHGTMLLARLDVHCLRQMRRATNKIPKRLRHILDRLVATACHGRERALLVEGNVNLADVAHSVLLRQLAIKSPTPSAQKNMDTNQIQEILKSWKKRELAFLQLTMAATTNDEALAKLLGILADEDLDLNHRLNAAELLGAVASYRVAEGVPVRNRTLQLVENILKKHSRDGPPRLRDIWLNVQYDRFLLLPIHKRQPTFHMLRNPLGRQPLAMAAFLSHISRDSAYAVPDSHFALELAEVIASTYAEVFKIDSVRRAGALNGLLEARKQLTPERFHNEIPLNRSKSSMPPQFQNYRPPSEWKAWLERFRKLPAFAKAKKTGKDGQPEAIAPVKIPPVPAK